MSPEDTTPGMLVVPGTNQSARNDQSAAYWRPVAVRSATRNVTKLGRCKRQPGSCSLLYPPIHTHTHPGPLTTPPSPSLVQRPTTFNDHSSFTPVYFSLKTFHPANLFTLHLRIHTFTTTTQMATTPTTAASLHAPSKPAAACIIENTVQNGSETTAESPEHVDIEFWQTTQALNPESYLPSISLDENGKPPFYQECSDAIRYSSAYLFHLLRSSINNPPWQPRS